MLTANLNNSRVYADECTDRKADYRCPECGERVILARGSVKIPHFKHEAHTACEYSGETMEHLRAKAWLYRTLKRNPDIEYVEAECSRFEGIRPDVAFKHRRAKSWIGIEIQHSSISIEEIWERCHRYQKQKVAILWIASEKTFKKINEAENLEVRLSNQTLAFYELHRSLFVFTGEKILAFQLDPVYRVRQNYNYYTDEYYGDVWEEQLSHTKKIAWVIDVSLNRIMNSGLNKFTIYTQYGPDELHNLCWVETTSDDWKSAVEYKYGW